MAYRTPKDVQEKKEAKRRQILHAAVKTFARLGFNGASVRDIVDEAGVSVGTFYFYFKSKEAIFETLYDEMNKIFFCISGEAIQENQKSLVEKVARATTQVFQAVQKYRELTRIMHIEAVGLNPAFERKRAEAYRQLYAQMEDYFRLQQEKGTIKVPDVKVSSLAYYGAIVNIVMEWLQDGDSGSDLTDSAYPLVIHNLQALQVPFDPAFVKQVVEETRSGSYECELFS